MKRIGVLTSGGDAPGMNAAIRAVVRAGADVGIEIMGIYRGYDGLVDGDIVALSPASVSGILQSGGTILLSARSKVFRTKEGRTQAAKHLAEHNIEGLVVIGGDGTFTGAKILREEHGIVVAGVPGTIDNDLYGTDYTIGFDTAVNTVVSAVDNIRDTAASHQRVFFVEVMGRDSGYIALNAAVACGAEDVFIPETRSDIEKLRARLLNRNQSSRRSSVVIVAEGDELGGAKEIADLIKGDGVPLDIRCTILGHIQRGGRPTMRDRILASRMGAAALSMLLEGKSDVMTGVVNGEIVATPFAEAIGKRKELSRDLIVLNDIMTH